MREVFGRRRRTVPGPQMSPREVTGEAAGEIRRLVPDVETLARRLAEVDYLVDEGLATSIFLGLRLMKGLDLETYQTRFGSDLRDQYEADLNRLVDAGLIEIDEGLMRLTKRGALLSNEVFAALA